jgi:hypothetical protein
MQLTGANVAYHRSIVGDVIAWASAGEWENVAHERLRARGSSLHFVESAPVFQNKSYEFWDFCVRTRYQHGRDYARTRLVEEGRRSAMAAHRGHAAPSPSSFSVEWRAPPRPRGGAPS